MIHHRHLKDQLLTRHRDVVYKTTPAPTTIPTAATPRAARPPNPTRTAAAALSLEAVWLAAEDVEVPEAAEDEAPEAGEVAVLAELSAEV